MLAYLIRKYPIIPICLVIIPWLTSCSATVSYHHHRLAYHHSNNLWDNLADDFKLPDENAYIPAIKTQISWYMHHPQWLCSVANNAKYYLYYIYQQLKQRHLPGELALLPMIESAYNPFAYSHKGAAGLWQIMPGTASGFGLKINGWYDGRRDIIASTNAALDYLSYLGKFFNGNWLLAIAAYNSGEGTIEHAVNQNQLGYHASFWQLTLPAQTRAYVIELLALATIINQPQRYFVKLPAIKAAPYFTSVNIHLAIDLLCAAKMAGMSVAALSQLNPGFNRWYTDPSGPYYLLIPYQKASRVRTALAHGACSQLIHWQRYRVGKKDNLTKLAQRFNTTAKVLRHINYIPNHARLYVGQTLLIPLQRKNLNNTIMTNKQRYFHSLHHLPEINVIHYRVMPGDNLWSIARKYHVTLRQLRFWNKLSRHQILLPGTILTIWPTANLSH